jgi:hypothetical protein
VNGYRIAAELVLILHSGFIAFVLFGLLAVLIGMAARWEWTRNFWFRVAHLAAIAYVVVQTLFGMVCPLTILENHLRGRAGQDPYGAGGFIQYWLHKLIFFDAEPWVFTACYTAFGLLVAVTWWLAPPRRASEHGSSTRADPKHGLQTHATVER